jgi:hypothetical protein
MTENMTDGKTAFYKCNASFISLLSNHTVIIQLPYYFYGSVLEPCILNQILPSDCFKSVVCKRKLVHTSSRQMMHAADYPIILLMYSNHINIYPNSCNRKR